MRMALPLSVLFLAAVAGCSPLPGARSVAGRAPAEWPQLLPVTQILTPGAPAASDPTAGLEARAAALKARAAALRQAEF